MVALADGTEEEHDDDSQTLVHGGYEYRAFPSPCVPHGVSSYHGKPKFMLPPGFEASRSTPTLRRRATSSSATTAGARCCSPCAPSPAPRPRPSRPSTRRTRAAARSPASRRADALDPVVGRHLGARGLPGDRPGDAAARPPPAERRGAEAARGARGRLDRRARNGARRGGARRARGGRRAAARPVAPRARRGGAPAVDVQPTAAGRISSSALRKEVARLKAEAARLRAVRTALAAAVALLGGALESRADHGADGAERGAACRKGSAFWIAAARRETRGPRVASSRLGAGLRGGQSERDRGVRVMACLNVMQSQPRAASSTTRRRRSRRRRWQPRCPSRRPRAFWVGKLDPPRRRRRRAPPARREAEDAAARRAIVSYARAERRRVHDNPCLSKIAPSGGARRRAPFWIEGEGGGGDGRSGSPAAPAHAAAAASRSSTSARQLRRSDEARALRVGAAAAAAAHPGSELAAARGEGGGRAAKTAILLARRCKRSA